MTDDEVKKHTILKCVIGSTLYGTNNAESDVDQMGVCVEPLDAVAGFNNFEQHIRQERDAAGVMRTEDKIYSLKKFLRLALGGNPDVTPVFFVPVKFHTVSVATGRQMQELAPHIVSRKSGVKFLGYMESQRQRMLGERGQKGVQRAALVEQFGFDTKYAMQIIRLGLNGIELLSTGRMSFPMSDDNRVLLLDIRNGVLSMNEVLQKAGDLERELKDAVSDSPLPEEPNYALVEDWMINTYWEHWKADRFMSDRLQLSPGVH